MLVLSAASQRSSFYSSASTFFGKCGLCTYRRQRCALDPCEASLGRSPGWSDPLFLSCTEHSVSLSSFPSANRRGQKLIRDTSGMRVIIYFVHHSLNKKFLSASLPSSAATRSHHLSRACSQTGLYYVSLHELWQPLKTDTWHPVTATTAH